MSEMERLAQEEYGKAREHAQAAAHADPVAAAFFLALVLESIEEQLPELMRGIRGDESD